MALPSEIMQNPTILHQLPATSGVQAPATSCLGYYCVFLSGLLAFALDSSMV